MKRKTFACSSWKSAGQTAVMPGTGGGCYGSTATAPTGTNDGTTTSPDSSTTTGDMTGSDSVTMDGATTDGTNATTTGGATTQAIGC